MYQVVIYYRKYYKDSFPRIGLLMILPHFSLLYLPLWFTNDNPQGQFSSIFLNLLYKIKILEKDENQNNLWSLSCPSEYVIFTTLADAKLCFVFAERQIALPKGIIRSRIREWYRLTFWKMTKCYNTSQAKIFFKAHYLLIVNVTRSVPVFVKFVHLCFPNTMGKNCYIYLDRSD